MSDEVLERLIVDFMKLELPNSSFAWQGGEPTLMGLDFYKKAVELQKKNGRDGQVVSNALQTNGILLDDKWCQFLNEYQWLVGISLDGPAEYHDYYRLDKAGKGTFEKVMASIENCRKHEVEFNILVLLNDRNVKAADELFDFFVDKKIKYLQFIPCVERDPGTNEIASFSVTAQQYGDFLCKTFDRWLNYGIDKISIRIIDSILNYIVYGRHTNCTFAQRCDDYIVIEHNGDAFCCDFFVEDDYRLGNICQTPIEQLAHGERKRQFAKQKRSISNKCLVCRYNEMCRGGCMKDRIVTNGQFNVPSYYCEAYKQFFSHALPRLTQIAAEVTQS